MDKKSLIKAGSCLLATSGLFISAIVQSQSNVSDELKVRTEAKNDVATLVPSGDWSIAARSDRCRLSRKFGVDKDAVLLRIEKGGTDATFNLTLFGKAVGNPMGSVISTQFGPDQDAFGRHYITAKSSAGRPAIVLYGASFAATTEDEKGTYAVLEPDQEALSRMNYLQIERAGLTPFRLDFEGSLVDVSEAMDECTKALMERLRIASTGKAKSAEPAGSPGSWVSPKDYPSMMLRYEKEGLVRFRLTVNRKGKPTFCSIEKSSLPQMFDDSVCFALLKKAKFEPALDWEGNPVQAYWRSAIRFEIP